MSQPVDRKRLRDEVVSPSTGSNRPTMWRSIWKRVNYGGGNGVNSAVDSKLPRSMIRPSSPCYDIDDDDDSSSSSEYSSSLSNSDDDYYECQSSSSGDYYDATDRSFSPEVDMDDLNKTHFPDFHLENIPDGELTDTSDTESNQEEKQRKYTTKEDQDVVVFLTLAKRMTFKSLLHLLQGHVKTLNPSPEYLQTYKAASEDHQNQSKSRPGRKGSLIKKKQFRWAEVNNDQVRVVVHPIESWKDEKDLWWRQHEMNSIRSDLIDTVQFFRKHRHEYMNSVEIVAKGELSELVVESHMKKLTDDSYARGLETHIVKFLSDHRKAHVTAVVQEFMECKESGDNYEMTSHCLRSQSLAYSQLTTNFASRIAKCDEIDALKSKISKWEQPSQLRRSATAVGSFTR